MDFSSFSNWSSFVTECQFFVISSLFLFLLLAVFVVNSYRRAWKYRVDLVKKRLEHAIEKYDAALSRILSLQDEKTILEKRRERIMELYRNKVIKINGLEDRLKKIGSGEQERHLKDARIAAILTEQKELQIDYDAVREARDNLEYQLNKSQLQIGKLECENQKLTKIKNVLKCKVYDLDEQKKELQDYYDLLITGGGLTDQASPLRKKMNEVKAVENCVSVGGAK